MAGPLIPIAVQVAKFIAKKGMKAAIKKFGKKAVEEAKDAAKEEAITQSLEKVLGEGSLTGSSLNPAEFKRKAKSKKFKQQEKEADLKKAEKYDPSYKKMAKSMNERKREIKEGLDAAKQTGDTKKIKSLKKRYENLLAMEKDDMGSLVHRNTGGKFYRGGLVRTGHTDHRKKGLFK